MQDDEFDTEELPPSKSQLKRDAHALQQLGTELLEVKEDTWQALQLPDGLIAALREARRMPSRGARKRQLQYIGKLMRDIDPEPIQHYFEQLRLETRHLARKHHELEDWRDRMIAEGDTAIEEFLVPHPAADRQHLRQLVRQARKEQAADKPPKSSRALFRYIRDSS
jgi:ribosome-associated protein